MNFINWLKGKKSYLLAFALLAYAAGGYFTGNMSSQEALALLWSSGFAASIRAAIAKAPPTLPQ